MYHVDGKGTNRRRSKKFAWAIDLIRHLRADSHSNDFQCPVCFRCFSSATALTQHAESQSNKCHMRKTRDYGHFVDQLTAGLAEVGGRHADDTLRYLVPEKAGEAIIKHAPPGQETMLQGTVVPAAPKAEGERRAATTMQPHRTPA